MTIPIVMTSQHQWLNPEVEEFLASSHEPVIRHIQCREWFHPDAEKNRCINIAKGRTEALRLAERYESEYFFFLDDDVVPPRGAIHTLLSRDKDVIGGWFPARHADWVGGRWVANGIFSLFSRVYDEPVLTETHLLSLGCTLVKRSLIEGKVFNAGIDQLCRDVYGHTYHIADSGAFSRDLRQAGVEMFLDADVVCKHYAI